MSDSDSIILICIFGSLITFIIIFSIWLKCRIDKSKERTINNLRNEVRLEVLSEVRNQRQEEQQQTQVDGDLPPAYTMIYPKN